MKVKPKKAPAKAHVPLKSAERKPDRIVQMSNAERKEYLRNAEVIDIKPNPNPGTDVSFIVTLADGTQGIFKPERSAK